MPNLKDNRGEQIKSCLILAAYHRSNDLNGRVMNKVVFFDADHMRIVVYSIFIPVTFQKFNRKAAGHQDKRSGSLGDMRSPVIAAQFTGKYTMSMYTNFLTYQRSYEQQFEKNLNILGL